MKLRHDMLTHGVNVVTAAHEGKRAGLAIAWATQISKDRVLIAVGEQSATRPLILASGAFGLCVLAKDQLALAQLFGRRTSADTDKFRGLVVHTAETGSPLLDDCIWVLDCRVEAVHDAGYEKLIVGRIVAATQPRPDAEGLTYREEDY